MNMMGTKTWWGQWTPVVHLGSSLPYHNWLFFNWHHHVEVLLCLPVLYFALGVFYFGIFPSHRFSVSGWFWVLIYLCFCGHEGHEFTESNNCVTIICRWNPPICLHTPSCLRHSNFQFSYLSLEAASQQPTDPCLHVFSFRKYAFPPVS
jgi:hypothetical protein